MYISLVRLDYIMLNITGLDISEQSGQTIDAFILEH